MDLSNVFNYKVHNRFPLEQKEPVQEPVAASTFKWNNYTVEVLTKAALVCGSILAGSIFATASVVYSKIISGIVMIGFAAAAVVRWVNPPANRVQIPENTNLVEGQSVSLDHSEDIFITSTFEQPWYKDGKRVAGAVAGAAVLTGLSILAYYKVSDQEIDEGVSPAIFKGLISPAPWERPMLSNSAIDDALSHGGLSRAETMKSFSKFFRVNNTLLEMANAQVFPMVSSKFSVCDFQETIKLSPAAEFLSNTTSFLSEESEAIPMVEDAINNSGRTVAQLWGDGPLLLSSDAVNGTLSEAKKSFAEDFHVNSSKFSASSVQDNPLGLVNIEASSEVSKDEDVEDFLSFALRDAEDIEEQADAFNDSSTKVDLSLSNNGQRFIAAEGNLETSKG